MYQKYQPPNHFPIATSLNLDTGGDMSISGARPLRRIASFEVDVKRDGEGISMTIGITGRDGTKIGCVTMTGLSTEVATEIEATLLRAAAIGDPLQMVEGFENAFVTALAHEAKVSADFARGGSEISAHLNDALTSSMQESDFVQAMSVSNITKDIFHVSCSVKYLMASTFLRFQEHYESSEFRNKIFTLEEFKTWFRGARQHGQFSYYDECAGFNFPSSSLVAFMNGSFDPLSVRERAFLSQLPKVPGDFYVIGTCGEEAGLPHLQHEIAHGLYCTNQEYRRRVDAVLDDLDLTPIEAVLSQHGYHKSVFRDECHAYLGEDLEYLRRKQIDVSPYAEAHKTLLRLYEEFLASSVR